MTQTNPWKALTALCTGFFMILLDQTIVAVATPALQAELGADLGSVVWVTSIYLLAYAVPLLVTGRLGDRFGQRNMYVAGMVVFTLSSLACGLAPSIGWLIAARLVQGLGASMLTPQSMSVINRIFPREKRGAAMGVWGAVAGLASLAGPVLGGLIVGTVGWQWIFFINVPVGIVCILMVLAWVPDLGATAARVDVFSVLTVIPAMFLVVFSLQEGPNFGWAWWLFLGLLAGLALIGVFLWLQTRAEHPLLPLAVFSNSNFSHGSFSISTMGFAVAGTMLPIMLYLQEGRGLSAEAAGLMLVPMAVISGVFAPFVGRMADRLHPRVLSMFGFGMMVVAMLSLVVIMRDSVPVGWMLLGSALLGVGNAFVWSPNATTTMRDMDVDKLGAASGVYNTSRQVGAVVGSAAIGAAMQVFVQHTSVANAMGLSMIVPLLVLCAGFISVSRFRAQPLHTDS
ncbi:Multidrug resistance protein stp [Corynebacterium kalinowskii]|uniref:Multidrug resistance protein stp n=1 Tax=Corynebacterium kalinowskii TaxID=2675216 RepID=A0A6B8W2H2_9CORY|nr:DHA2 family efflux MFS transporter permease subunit [Corynebacterium kalinowskii]QGU01828.1 Multidrug resistance protein stp [Corynebacterium kalinowskii]